MSSGQIRMLSIVTTGCIGDSLLTRLLQHQNASNFKITPLIRGDESRVKKLASRGVTSLISSNDSSDILQKAASESDVVMHTANSIAGIAGKDLRGKKGLTSVDNDLDSDQINAVVNDKTYSKINLPIINAVQGNPELKNVIVLPPFIYATVTGLFNRISVQLPTLVPVALKRVKGETIGSGDTAWNTVHIPDLVDCYILLLDQLLAAYGPDPKSNAKPSS